MFAEAFLKAGPFVRGERVGEGSGDGPKVGCREAEAEAGGDDEAHDHVGIFDVTAGNEESTEQEAAGDEGFAD